MFKLLLTLAVVVALLQLSPTARAEPENLGDDPQLFHSAPGRSQDSPGRASEPQGNRVGHDELRPAASDPLVTLDIAVSGSETIRVQGRANRMLTYELGDRLAFGVIPQVSDLDLGTVTLRVVDLVRQEGILRVRDEVDQEPGQVGFDSYSTVDSHAVQMKVISVVARPAGPPVETKAVREAMSINVDPEVSGLMAGGGCCLGCSGPLVCGCSVTMSCGSCDQCN